VAGRYAVTATLSSLRHFYWQHLSGDNLNFWPEDFFSFLCKPSFISIKKMFLPPLISIKNAAFELSETRTKEMLDTLRHMNSNDVVRIFAAVEDVNHLSVLDTFLTNSSRLSVRVVGYEFAGIHQSCDQTFYLSTGTSRNGTHLKGFWLPYTHFDTRDNRFMKPEDTIIAKLESETYSDGELAVMHPAVVKYGRFLNKETAMIAKSLFIDYAI
jgi:hypothetical protein